MEVRRCQIQPLKHSERLVMKFQALLIKKYVNALENNQSEDNDEQDRYFIPENPQDNKDDMPTKFDVKKMKMKFRKFSFPVSPKMLMTQKNLLRAIHLTKTKKSTVFGARYQVSNSFNCSVSDYLELFSPKHNTST